MLTWIREKFGTVVIGGIIAFIAFVFVFYGVFSPKATRGMHEGAVAGTVNGDAITLTEFNRELNQRLEQFRSFGGGSLTEEQLRSLGVRQNVFQQLVQRKLLLQQAKKMGLTASDAEVRERIQEIGAFQKDGKFNVAVYRERLEAARYTPGSFEKAMRDDLSVQKVADFLREHHRFSEAELQKEFQIEQDKRMIKYVLFTPEAVKKEIQVDAKEVQGFLGDATKLAIAQRKYEEGKATTFKGQNFDAVKDQIVRGILAEGKTDEVQKQIAKATDEVLGLAKASAGTNDAKLNALLKRYSLEMKTTGWMTRRSISIPGFGDTKELATDAFKGKQAAPKKYTSANRVLVAWVSGAQTPDLAKFDAEKEGLIRRVTGRKVQEFFGSWMDGIQKKATIDMNQTVVGGES